jgi:hypothetical protein
MLHTGYHQYPHKQQGGAEEHVKSIPHIYLIQGHNETDLQKGTLKNSEKSYATDEVVS